jgi:hypothetical protein
MKSKARVLFSLILESKSKEVRHMLAWFYLCPSAPPVRH